MVKLMKKVFFLTEKKLNALIAEQIEKSKQQHAIDLKTEIINKQINLSSLQSQINPHFLYNALECVRGRAIIDKAPFVADMVQTLANYFRYSISSKSNIVTIREELKNIDNYLKIQQFRYNNRFNIEIIYNHRDDILDAILPKLTLQPILENSIIRGFERKLGEADIKIDIVATRKNINIVISDNGMGISKVNLKKLNDSISKYDVLEQKINSSHGLAMPNVNKRLKLFFGEKYGIHVSSIEGIGTDVEIHIPYLIDNNKERNYEKRNS